MDEHHDWWRDLSASIGSASRVVVLWIEVVLVMAVMLAVLLWILN